MGKEDFFGSCQIAGLHSAETSNSIFERSQSEAFVCVVTAQMPAPFFQDFLSCQIAGLHSTETSSSVFVCRKFEAFVCVVTVRMPPPFFHLPRRTVLVLPTHKQNLPSLLMPGLDLYFSEGTHLVYSARKCDGKLSCCRGSVQQKKVWRIFPQAFHSQRPATAASAARQAAHSSPDACASAFLGRACPAGCLPVIVSIPAWILWNATDHGLSSIRLSYVGLPMATSCRAPGLGRGRGLQKATCTTFNTQPRCLSEVSCIKQLQ